MILEFTCDVTSTAASRKIAGAAVVMSITETLGICAFLKKLPEVLVDGFR